MAAPMFSSFDGKPFEDVAEIICRNPDLRSLLLSLQGKEAIRVHKLYSEMENKALAQIGCAVSDLRSLTLENELRFTDEA